MIGKGKLIKGVKTLYKSSRMGRDTAYPDKASSEPEVDILEEVGAAYKVRVHSVHFNPNVVWIPKNDVVNVYMIEEVKKPEVKPTVSSGGVGLETGDTMELIDKNGTKVGVWIFRKY